MISVEQALTLVSQQIKKLATEEVPLLAALGRVLAKPVTADRDFPPFDRATMDGIAVNSAFFEQSGKILKVEAVQPAGTPRLVLSSDQNCIEIMTGAILPVGTDAVIRYEDISINDGYATVTLDNVASRQNVHLQGTDLKKNDIIIEAGAKITPGIISALASVGLSAVSVYTVPRVAVCSTGDELTDVGANPEPHQIRRSNDYMLLADLLNEGIKASSCHLPDAADIIEEQIIKLMAHNDVILFSGAVSKGKFDFLPKVCEKLGMQTLFHGIAQRPGKPMLFGRMGNGTLIFGLPGNPVSTWVCYQLYFKSWLYQSLRSKVNTMPAALENEVTFKPSLTRHLLISYVYSDNKVLAREVRMSTSGDLMTLTKAEGILSLPANEEFFAQGRVFSTQPMQ